MKRQINIHQVKEHDESPPNKTKEKIWSLTEKEFRIMIGKVKGKGKSLSHVRLFATLWSVAHQASGYWSGLPFPSPGDLLDPRIEPGSPAL